MTDRSLRFESVRHRHEGKLQRIFTRLPSLRNQRFRTPTKLRLIADNRNTPSALTTQLLHDIIDLARGSPQSLAIFLVGFFLQARPDLYLHGSFPSGSTGAAASRNLSLFRDSSCVGLVNEAPTPKFLQPTAGRVASHAALVALATSARTAIFRTSNRKTGRPIGAKGPMSWRRDWGRA